MSKKKEKYNPSVEWTESTMHEINSERFLAEYYARLRKAKENGYTGPFRSIFRQDGIIDDSRIEFMDEKLSAFERLLELEKENADNNTENGGKVDN